MRLVTEMKPPAQRGLPPEEFAAAQAALRSIVKETGNQTAAGHALGFSQAAVSKALISVGAQIGPDLARAIERHVGKSLKDLARVESAEPAQRIVETEGRPNLDAVIEMFRGARPDEFLDAFRSGAHTKSPVDLPLASWREMLDGAWANWRGKSVLKPDLLGDEMAEGRRGPKPKRPRR